MTTPCICLKKRGREQTGATPERAKSARSFLDQHTRPPATPQGARLQILLIIGFFEFWSESAYVLEQDGTAPEP